MDIPTLPNITGQNGNLVAYATPPTDGTSHHVRLQQLVNQAQENGDGILTLGPGTWLLDNPIEVDSTTREGYQRPFCLQGVGSSTQLVSIYNLEDRRNKDILSFQWSHREPGIYRIVRDLTLNQDPTQPVGAPHPTAGGEARGIYANNQTSLRLHGINFLNLKCGLYAEGDTADQWGDFHIDDCKFFAHQDGTKGIFFKNVKNSFIRTCRFDVTNVGIHCLDSCETISVSQCSVICGGGYDYGILFEGNDNYSISDCWFEGAKHACIWFAQSSNPSPDVPATFRSRVTNCWFGDASFRPDGSGRGGLGIQSDSGNGRLIISNNRFGDLVGPAIDLDRNKLCVITGNIFEGNCRSNQGDSQIHLEGCTNIVISNNIFCDPGPQARAQICFNKDGEPRWPRSSLILIVGNSFADLTSGDLGFPVIAGKDNADVMFSDVTNMRGPNPPE